MAPRSTTLDAGLRGRRDAVSTPHKSQGAHARGWAIGWTVVLGLTLAIHLAAEHLPWAVKYPREWVVPLRFWVSDFMKWLVNDFDLGPFTFKEATRSIAWLLAWPLELAQSFLATGFRVGLGDEARELFPRVSWLALGVVAALVGRAARDWRLGALAGACFAYLAVFGQWDSAMVTLASIAIAVPLSAPARACSSASSATVPREPAFEKIVTPVLDLMQTVPVFAYLVPVLFLFGFGPVAAMIATIIYATPPMVRVTMLALAQVPEEVVEFGRMAGCSARQMTWKVLIPSARPALMVGVNQVIMLSLNMVIIASMIGAGGLGFDVLNALRRQPGDRRRPRSRDCHHS